MISILIDIVANFAVRIANDIFDAIISGFGLDTTLSIMSKSSLANTILAQTGIYYLSVFFRVLGWVILFMGAIVAIGKIIMGQGRNKVNPINLIIKLVIAGLMIGLSEEVFSFLSYGVSGLFSLISGTWAGNADWNVPLTISLDITENLMRLAFYIALAFAEMGAVISYLERVVLFTIYLYFYPVAMGFMGSEQGSETFIDWLKGLFSQLLAILLSYSLMYMGMDCVISAINNSNIGGIINVQISVDILNLLKSNDALVMFAMGLVLFNTSKSVEKLLAMFNIKTMKVGESAASLRGAIATAGGLAGAAFGTLMSSVNDRYGIAKQNYRNGVTNSPTSPRLNKVADVVYGAKVSPTPMESGIDKTARQMFQNTKFDSKGNPIMPGSGEMMAKATESGVIQKNIPSTFAGKFSQNIENMKTRDKFTQGVSEKLKTMNEAKQNLNSQLQGGELNPTVKMADGTVSPMSNKDLYDIANISEINPNIKPKEGYVTPAYIDNDPNKLGYVFEGVNTKNGQNVEYLYTSSNEEILKGNEEINAYTYKSDDGKFRDASYIYTPEAKETTVVTRTISDRGSFVVGNSKDSEYMANISMKKTESEVIPANTKGEPREKEKEYKKTKKTK